MASPAPVQMKEEVKQQQPSDVVASDDWLKTVYPVTTPVVAPVPQQINAPVNDEDDWLNEANKADAPVQI